MFGCIPTRAALSACATLAALLMPSHAMAQVTTRYHGLVNGNFVIVGNTLGQDVAPGVPVPIDGSVGATGSNTGDTGPDVFWVSNFPSFGQATANSSITAAQARSQAIFGLPPTATFVYARLYWAAVGTGASADTSVELSRAGTGAFTQTITADATMTLPGDRYQGTADITSIVQARGTGTYQLSGVDCVDLVNRNDPNVFVSWSMVVVYQLPGDPAREVFVADGFNEVSPGSPATAMFTLDGGFPASGNARLGAVAYAGDATITGDTLTVNSLPIADALNPMNNVFNSTRGFQGTPSSNTGDLPRLFGTAGGMCGVDLDLFDITPTMSIGATTVSATFNTTNDVYILGVVAVASGTTATCQSASIDEQPQPVTACAGDTAQFTVTASGTSPLTYQWRKNSTALATQRGISGVNSSVLTIEGLVSSDVASYDCIVTSPCGAANSNAVALTVQQCCDADFNQSGVISVQDIFDFLEAYFAGCP